MRLLVIIFALLSFSVFGQKFELKKMKFNTSSNEFAPLVVDGEVIYCSDERSNMWRADIDLTGSYSISWTSTSSANSLLPELAFLADFMHLGPLSYSTSTKQIAFSGVRPNRFAAVDKPGIYFCNIQADGSWSKPEAFDWNSTDGAYSCAHPSFSLDGKTLFYACDMEGGNGQSDIYYSQLTGQGWGDPVHLGADINTGGRELYPFSADDGRLFFASDSLDGALGLDVFSTQLGTKGKWVRPERLPAPFNSKFDDYGVFFAPDGLSGYMTSDRVKGDADIYDFKFSLPTLKGCPEAYQTSFCYLIEETEIQETDTLPITYEWDFGDGTKAEGMSHEHCYLDFGSYDLAFNIYDTLTQIQFAQVSQVHIDIEPARIPLFQIPDSVNLGTQLELYVNDLELDGFEVDQYFWQIQGQSSILGDSAKLAFNSEGVFEVSLGAIGKSVNGKRQVRCGARMITVSDLIEPDALVYISKMERLQALRPSRLANDLKPAELELIYFIEFHESDRQVPFNDPYFSEIDVEITERFIYSDSLFHYSVGNTNDILKLHALQSALLESGYHEAVVRDVSRGNYEDETLKSGSYYSDEEKEVMNSMVQSLENIQFEVNSSLISPSSKKNLNQIVSILLLDEGFRLKVSAHTDNKGGIASNQKLSEERAAAVVDYLVGRGIAADRISAKGYGASRAMASNKNEAGRFQNRRVEFTLLFEK
ncbi:MAG: outer membrane protein OmpA-like peptidoglycan-associated protein [Flavobacteriales bacterium]|jgi:outer membrane protein OmpA-like peptidoglycan-associated protein